MWFASGAAAIAAQQPSVSLDFDIVGIRLTVDPAVLTVPKNIPTQINTALALPAGTSADTQDAVNKLTAGAVVEADLRGPSFPSRHIVVTPGKPIPIPPFAIPGDYFLDQIRLTRNGQTILNATPPTVPIKVIAEVLVTSVTTRPLSLEEIRQKGIVIDDKNFQALNFNVTFNVEGKNFKIDMPVLSILAGGPDFAKEKDTLLKQLTLANTRLTQTVQLPPELDRPGLNFMIAPLPFIKVESEDDGGFGFGPPPITGLVIIPGNIAFLNQFFSVQVIVGDVAPDGTPLVLRDVTAKISLPTGGDHAAGTYDAPGDDPLRLARVQGVGQQSVVAVTQPGPDGKFGTADDLPLIGPQQSGRGEFLVEGLQEGSQTIDFTINATLDGLPSGPVALTGQATGAVLVRNPTFSITLAHPRTIRSGEPYNLFATVTNTSTATANLVSVNMDPRAVLGARLVSASSVQFETLAAGQSVTAKFSLIAQRTGNITFSSFTTDNGLSGRLQLTTGVDERDVPLAPNVIVLPPSADLLPESLIAASQRVLGQAFSVSSAPAGALPAGVLWIKRQTIVDRGLQLADAGQRLEFGEPLPTVLQDLLLDWTGSSATADDGFDQLLRSTNAGADWFAEVAAILNQSVTSAGVLDFQQQFASMAAVRVPHLSVVSGSGGGAAPVVIHVLDDANGRLGDDDEGPIRSIPYGNLLELQTSGAAHAQLALLTHVNPARYTIEAVATAAGDVDLGVVVPAAGGSLAQLRFPHVTMAAGGIARLVVDLSGAPSSALLQVDQNGDGVVDRTVSPITVTITSPPLQLLTVRQTRQMFDTPDDPGDPATYGLIVGAFFNRPVDKASAEDVSHYGMEKNAIRGAKMQVTGRLVLLYLDRPIGSYVAHQLTAQGVMDTAGNVLAPATVDVDTIYSDGAHVVGQVRTADGKPVPGALLDVSVPGGGGQFSLARFRTDSTGSYDLEFVRKLELPGWAFTVTAQHPTTLKFATLKATIRAAGQTLLLNPTFIGRATVRGHVFFQDNVTPIAGAPVVLNTSSLAGGVFQINANAAGEYVLTNVPVGPYTVSSKIGGLGIGIASGLIATADQDAVTDIVVVDRTHDSGSLVGRAFLADGQTGAAGFEIFVGTFSNGDPSRNIPPTIAAVDRMTADGNGSFSFTGLVAGSYDVVAFDAATQRLGRAKATVIANTVNAVSIRLEASGSVQGVVFDAQGNPKAGALVAGGFELVTTDANGFFRIDDLPAGLRTLDAGDPVTKRRGSASVEVLPGETVPIAITLEARATIIGRVFDSAGNPVPRATVRIPGDEGYTFVFANNQGFFKFPDMALGDYLIEAPGPPQEALIEIMAANGIDPSSAYTMGDAPANLPGTLEQAAQNPDTALAAYQLAVETFFGLHDPRFVGVAPPPPGGYGWTRVKLFQDSFTSTANIHYLTEGSISGMTVDGDDRPTAAIVRVTTIKPSRTGAPTLQEIGRVTTEVGVGTFSFSGIPLFDLATAQIAGVRTGDFSVQAANPFSTAIPQYSGALNVNTPNQSGIILKFPKVPEVNGTISGSVVMPDGMTPAPAGTKVFVDFQGLTLTTDADGKFSSLVPIPKGTYQVLAQEPVSGLQGVAGAAIPAGGNVSVRIRLLGLGSVSVIVQRPDGTRVSHATVKLVRGTFPGDTADGPVDQSGAIHFTNITEGPFSVTATEAATGLSGLASGTVVIDADTAVVVVITASGRVTGTFLSVDGHTPIPNAQVVVSGSLGMQEFSTTDANGRFEADAMPIGRFTADANDPLTGRHGRATGTIRFQNDAVDVTLVQLPRGNVEGRVVNSDGITPVAGAEVTVNGVTVTTRADGSFRVEGVASGTVSVSARDPISTFQGSATTVITSEGETAMQIVALEPFGALHVHVLDENGNPSGNSKISLGGGGAGREGTTDINGDFTFTFLRLGDYRVVATSIAAPHNGAIATAKVSDANQTADVTLRLRGVGTVVVTVVRSDGTTRVPSAHTTLSARGATGTDGPSGFGGSFEAFTDGAGVARFEGVPIGDFFASAELAPLAGVGTGVLAVPNTTATATVRLEPSATIAGRVLLPNGVTPATNAIVTMTYAATSGSHGTLQVTTGIPGTFQFTGIPLGTFDVNVLELFSSGVRNAHGTLTTDGQRFDLGDLVLDNTSPRVTSIDPADRATAVPLSATVKITFSEPMGSDLSNFRAADQPNGGPKANIVVTHNGSRIQGTLAVSTDRRMVTFTPAVPFESSGVYSVLVKGGPDGPVDESNLRMLDNAVSSFTAADTLPPTILSASPAANDRDITLDAVVRVTFSEAIAPGLSFVVTDGGGAAVRGSATLAVGNSVAIFTPADFLKANTTYTATIANATDLAGNPIAGGVFVDRFSTVDTLPPVITSVTSLPGGSGGRVIAGGSLTLQPHFDSDDVASVEYTIGGTIAQVIGTAPFGATFTLPATATSFSALAVATDRVGNRSNPFTVSIPLDANQPPTVTLASHAHETVVSQGQTVVFDVAAADDLALSQLVVSAVGAASFSSTQPISGLPTHYATSVSIPVPADAASNATITVQAAAIDSAGSRSAPATVTLSLRDAVKPTAAFASPVNGAVIIGGDPLAVSVTASDDAGLASITLQCAPALNGCGTVPASSSSAQASFTVDVPDTATGATITLTLTAADAAGNVSVPVVRTVKVADGIAPVVTSLELTAGGTQIFAGSPATVRAAATDNATVAAFIFTVEGAVAASGTVPVAVPAAQAVVDFSFAVPDATPDGGVVTVTVQARDQSGNTSAAVTLGLQVVANRAPVANAGRDQAITAGAVVTLDGSRSTDLDGDRLTYAWSLVTRPAGSAAVLTGPTAVRPTFTADVAGTYVAQLVVNDGVADSAVSTVTMSTGNVRPFADAGVSGHVAVTATAVLDGTHSSDANHDPLTYRWTLVSRPAGSAAALSNATTATPTLVADVAGTYAAQLVVNDGTVDSAPALVTMTTGNARPIANAGAEQHGTSNAAVRLAGSASFDPEGRPLSYRWSILAAPAGSAPVLSGADSATPTFTTDARAVQVLQLIVNDGELDSDPVTVVVTTENRVPVANAGTAQRVLTGSTVHLDGRASSDADGDALTYAWTMVSKPAGSAAILSGAATSQPTFVTDLDGDYVVRLIVNDGFVNSAPSTVTVTSFTPGALTLTPSQQSVLTTATASLTVTLSADAPTGGQTITLSSSNPSALAVPAAVLVAAGTRSAPFVATSAKAAGTVTVTASANEYVPATATVTVNLRTTALSLSDTLSVGRQVDLVMALAAPAPQGGVTFTVTSDAPGTVQPIASTVAVAAGGTTAHLAVNGVSAGSTIVRVSASGYAEATLPVTVTANTIALPASVDVLLGLTQTFTVTIGPGVAPAAGVTVAVTSDADAIAHVETPTVVVPQGASTATGSVRGVLPGTTALTASSAGYGTARATVNVTGILNILETAISFADHANATMTVRLEGAAGPLAAPAGGYSFTITTASSACVSAPVQGTIPAGATSVAVTLASAGTAALPCTTTVTVAGANVTGDSVSVTVTPASVPLRNTTGPGTTMISYFNPAPVAGAVPVIANPFAAISFFNPPTGGQTPTITPGSALTTISFFNPPTSVPPTVAVPGSAAVAISFFNPATTPVVPIIVPGSTTTAVSFSNGAAPTGGPVVTPSGTADGITFASGPTVILVSPKEVSRSAPGSYTLVLTGANLTGATQVTFSDPTGITSGAISVSVDGTTLSMPIVVAPTAPLATVTVSVTVPGRTTPVSADTVLKIVP